MTEKPLSFEWKPVKINLPELAIYIVLFSIGSGVMTNAISQWEKNKLTVASFLDHCQDETCGTGHIGRMLDF